MWLLKESGILATTPQSKLGLEEESKTIKINYKLKSDTSHKTMIYIINMSKGDNIKIDELDLNHIQENLSAPLIRVKQAIINPSFMISITPTNEEEFKIKPIIKLENGMAKIIGEEKINTLAKNEKRFPESTTPSLPLL